MEQTEKKLYAPWWVYVVVIVPVNIALRRLVLGDDTNLLVGLVSSLALIVALWWLITVVYRSTRAKDA